MVNHGPIPEPENEEFAYLDLKARQILDELALIPLADRALGTGDARSIIRRHLREAMRAQREACHAAWYSADVDAEGYAIRNATVRPEVASS